MKRPPELRHQDGADRRGEGHNGGEWKESSGEFLQMFDKIMSSIHSSRHSRIIIVLAAAFLLRLVVFASFIIPHEERCFTPDASEYDRLAVNILEHRVFSFSTPPSFTPNLSRTPGYPLFLAAVYLIFGHNVIVAIFFQIVIGGIAIFLTYRLGVMLFNETVALFAALFMATSPTLIIQGNFLLTEPLFTLLLLSGLYFLTSFFIEGRIFHLVMSGLLLSLSALTRPIALYFPLALIPLFAYKYRKSISRMTVVLLVFVIVFLLPVSGWVIRNYRITGTPMFCNIGDVNLLYYRAAGIMADVSGESFDATKQEFRQEYPLDLLNNPNEYEANIRLARNIILDHPFTFIKLTLKGFMKILIGPGRMGIYQILGMDQSEHNQPKILTVIVVSFMMVLMYSGFVYGIFLAISDRDYFIPFLILPILLYFTVLPAGPEGSNRFLIPVMPYISLVAGLGISGFFLTLKHQSNPYSNIKRSKT